MQSTGCVAMSNAVQVLKTASDLHRYLTEIKTFDFNPEHGRDTALYWQLKQILGLSDGKFIAALDDGSVSAEQYLCALLEIAEPLSVMYKEIIAYCGRANILRSKRGAQVEWETRAGDESIDFSDENFRVFEEVKLQVEPSLKLMFSVKNDLMSWLANDVFAPNHQVLPRHDYDWRGIEIFSILENGRDRLGSEDHIRFICTRELRTATQF